MTYPVIAAAIEADTNGIVPDLSLEGVVSVVTEKPFKTGEGGSENVRKQSPLLLCDFGIDVMQSLHVIVVGVFVIGRRTICPHLLGDHLVDLSVHCVRGQPWVHNEARQTEQDIPWRAAKRATNSGNDVPLDLR